MTPILSERGIPHGHYTQTAFQKGISCADPTEVVQEVVKDYIQEGSTMYQCFYDLEKAFDSVEFVSSSTIYTNQVSMGRPGGSLDPSTVTQPHRFG